MKRALFPPSTAERADFRAACEADLVVWTASPGGAAMPSRLPFPNPRCDAEEIANAIATRDTGEANVPS